MSKGSPIITLRIPAELLANVQVVVAETGANCKGEPWNLTTWILQAIKDKLAHQQRAREASKRRCKGRYARAQRPTESNPTSGLS